ncbi:vacuolar protein sorting protein [Reticulomyxa filosa]|uniref:Vacuolar protein sorting protein n=1 Tax=Reticulomyxa filosa TaxID=46433 RepID=X6NJ04_RETFI|nr:vacuolar protein sorting protein [Reticulomyxa filosa]|eukprot:ETO26310.1 vacuolar protein sorting protein [Reticulomyxa filosa]
MGLYEEAVTFALDVPDNSFELAKSVVRSHKLKEPMANEENKRLWLLVARYVVKDSHDDMERALNIIKDSNCLSIEDILPHLSDFTNIGPFKPGIKSSLEKYSNNIKKLQEHMKTFTNTAEEIRKDTDLLKQRSMVVVSNKKCNLSQQPVLGTQFLLFPCQHVFRLDAAMQKTVSHYNINESKMNFNELLEIASKECPLCGQIMLEEVMKPFINPGDPKEIELARSWRIDDEFLGQDDYKMP